MRVSQRHINPIFILILFTTFLMLPLTGCGGGGSFGDTASPDTFWNNVLSDTAGKSTGTARDTLQGSTGIKPFWTYDTNAIGGGGKALVNLWGGNALVQYTDVSFPGRGLPVEIRRTYNSQTAFAGVFGPGWFSLLDTSVREADNKVILLDAYGGLFEFTNPQPSGSDTVYTAPPGRNTTLTKKADGTYTEKKKNGTTYLFDASGRLTRIQHRNANNYLTFVRDSSDLIAAIQEASGRTTAIEYNVKKKRITAITDPQGRVVKYAYQNNLLHRVTDPERHATLFDYNGQGFLSAITTPKKLTSTLAYDAASRVATWQDPLYTVNYQYAEGSTTVTDTYGHTLVYTLNQFGNNTSTVDTMGFTTSFEWDPAMNITKVTNAKNQVTDFTYDDRANLLSVANSLYTIRHTYDLANNLLSTVDGNGKTTSFTYQPTAHDPDGLLQSVTTPMGRTVSFTYNDYDEPLSVLNARGKTTQYAFSPNGDITAVTDSLGQSSSMVYNSVGEATSVTDPLSRTTAFTYDDNGMVLTVTTPSGARTSHKYDNHGNKTRTIDALGRATKWEFDDDDRMTEVVDAKGEHTVYTYSNGRLASTQDPAGFSTTMSYDANDRMTGRSNPITSESFTYDPLGNVLTKGTALGELQYGYDDINRLIAVSRPRKSTTFSYDNNNNRVQASSSDTDGTSVLSSISYTYGYDDDNRITAKTKKINGVNYEQTSYGYDPNSNLTHLGVTIKKGVPPTPVNAGTLSFAFDYEYDDLDRQSSVKNSKNDTYTAAYDEVGNMTNIHYPDNTNSARTFDNEDRITQVTNDHPIESQPHIIYSYAFDLLGNCTSFEKNPSVPYTGGAKRYEYDKLNRLTYDEAEQTKFVYDVAGNKTRDNLLSTGKHISFSYNQAHQLLSRVPGTGLGLPSYAYEYDSNGNQTRKNETASGKNVAPRNAADVKKSAYNTIPDIDPFASATLNRALSLIAQQSPDDGSLYFEALLRNPQGNPLCANEHDITAFFDGKQVSFRPARLKSHGSVCIDTWSYATGKNIPPGVHQFGLIVRDGGRDYYNTLSYTVGAASTKTKTASRDEGVYNGPPAHCYDSYNPYAVLHSLPSQVYHFGDKVVATIDVNGYCEHYNPLSSDHRYYTTASCSFSYDIASITLNGVPFSEYETYRGGKAPGGGNAQDTTYGLAYPTGFLDPSLNTMVSLPKLGRYVIEFIPTTFYYSHSLWRSFQKLYPAADVFLWYGPFVSVGGWHDQEPPYHTDSAHRWGSSEGFVITTGVQQTLSFTEVNLNPDSAEPGGQSEFNARLVASGFTPASLSWTITMADPSGTTLRTYSGTGDTITQDIDGTDLDDKPLPPGSYTITANATDNNGHTATTGPMPFNLVSPPEITDTRSTFDAANRLRHVKGYGTVSEQPWLVSDERFSYDPDDELFFSEQRKPFTPQDASMPPDGTSYRFVNLLEGYEGGLLLYTNKSSGTVRDTVLTTTSLAHVIEYYTYLNGVKVGITSIPGKGTGNNYYCSYDGQGNVEHVSNRAGTQPYEMYKYTAYGECSSYAGNAKATMSAYKGYDKGPFGNKCGVRHYDSESGRFISPDPFKGYMGDPGSQHPYMYCHGDPINYSDPSGYAEARKEFYTPGSAGDQDKYLPAELRRGSIAGDQLDAGQQIRLNFEKWEKSAAVFIVTTLVPELRLGKWFKGSGMRAYPSKTYVIKNVGHHTVPRQILKKLSPEARKIAQGKKGNRNIWDIPEPVHKEIHADGYNPTFQDKVDNLKNPTGENVIQIRDEHVKQYNIEQYRP